MQNKEAFERYIRNCRGRALAAEKLADQAEAKGQLKIAENLRQAATLHRAEAERTAELIAD